MNIANKTLYEVYYEGVAGTEKINIMATDLFAMEQVFKAEGLQNMTSVVVKEAVYYNKETA